ncbi:unnamed protein product [Sphenostylis stenocarpa]|uniref:IPT/TIG domain-containing protein n=1 Tax=Sphenostylis stenocarpa TaxID=92480 RepID=A0AA86RVY1_9FABA|nr:unnamed protein product [Sphenostylis stenocarpa]
MRELYLWIEQGLEVEFDFTIYTHILQGKSNSAPVTQLSSGSSLVFSASHSLYAAHNPGTSSTFADSSEPNQNFSSPGSLEVTSEAQALRQLEKELNLNEDSFNEIALNLIPCQDERVIYKQDKSATLSGPNDQGQHFHRYNGRQDDSDTYYHDLLDDCPDGNEKTIYWNEVLEASKSLPVTNLPDQYAYETIENEKSLFSSGRAMLANVENNQWLNSNSNNVENYSSLAIVQKQKFSIRAVSPEYCYAAETTKVIIIGSFLCHHSDSTWACMFGDVEVPAQIIQDGVICCETPSILLGKVNLCITSGNRVPCSEVREFEFRNKTTSCPRCNSLETEDLLLLVRFAEMVLSASNKKDDNIESGSQLSTEQKDGDDSWSHMIDTLLDGTGKSSETVNWLLEELLKDKLQLWLSNPSHERDEGTGCSLSKKEQGIIHMVSGLGFEWALNPILSCGVNINFRDINGWTALHWAARFGR